MAVTQLARGIRKVSNVITVAAAATPETLYQRTTGGQNPRTVIVRKVMVYNNTGANVVIDIGTGLGGAFARIMPSLYSITLFDNEWTEDDLPEVEVGADITVQSSVLGVQIQVEVEELGAG